VDYPNLWGYLRDLYRTPGFGETVNLALIKQGYYGNSWSLNPSGIVPRGPVLDFSPPRDRATRRYGA
jgi:putative glutathione S-transferase